MRAKHWSEFRRDPGRKQLTRCRANYPDTRVSCAAVDSLLIAALHRDEARTFKPVLDERSTQRSPRYCAPLPMRGSIVLLSASPPWSVRFRIRLIRICS
jgi:hypothetical protein